MICPVCGASLPTRTGPGRKRTYCSARCRNRAAARRWYAAHPLREKARVRAWQQKHRVQVNAANRRRYAAHGPTRYHLAKLRVLRQIRGEAPP